MTIKHDAVVIGTGQAGSSLAGRLAGAGMKVAIVERLTGLGEDEVAPGPRPDAGEQVLTVLLLASG